jgi:hypothetical protein
MALVSVGEGATDAAGAAGTGLARPHPATRLEAAIMAATPIGDGMCDSQVCAREG